MPNSLCYGRFKLRQMGANGTPQRVTLPCLSYTARPDGQGGTVFTCVP